MSDSERTSPPQAGTVRANLAALGIAEAIARLAQLLTMALLGRILGPVGLGIVGLAWAVYQLALPFVQYAPELMGARDVAQGKDTWNVFVDLTAIKLVVAVLSALVIAAAATLFYNDDPAARLQVLVQGPLLLIVAFNGVWAFRGLRRFAAYAIVRCAASVALLAVLAVALWMSPEPAMVPLSEGITGAAAAVLAICMLFGWRGAGEITARIFSRMSGLRDRISEAVQFGLGSFFAGAPWSVPLLVGSAFLDPAEQGHLAAALRLLVAVNALFQLVLQVFHPVLAQRYAHDRTAGGTLAAALVVYVLVATIPASLLLAAFAPWIIELLLGPGFSTTADTLVVLSSVIVPTIVSSVFGTCLLADGRYRLYVIICAGGALATVAGCGLAFYLFPQPEAVGVLTPILAVMGIAGGIAAWRLDLVQFSAVSWRQLMPSRIRAVLKER